MPPQQQTQHTCHTADICSLVFYWVEKSQFHINVALSSQPWGCHWEASVWLQPLSLRHPADHCSLRGWMESFGGEKCPVSMLQDWLSVTNKSSLFCMLIYSLLHQMKKKQEVCNKSLAIDDNGICACVCHLRKSNSGGVSTDLFVY